MSPTCFSSEKIFIRDLKVFCLIGIHPEERLKKQEVLLNIELDCECFRKAVTTDNIKDTLDYDLLSQEIAAKVSRSSFHLLESLATEVAQICLAKDLVKEVKVTIDKPQALKNAKSVAVELVYRKD